jgi:plastocyanin
MAMKNQMDATVQIAVGSAIQIALFVAPVLVFASMFMGHEHPLDLHFSILETIAVVLSVWILSLASQDVIHAFYVPQFLFKRDVVPGRVNTFEFKVNDSDAGQTFRGQCAELCGSGHRLMLFEVHALTGPQFDAWLQDSIAKHNATPPPAPSGGAGATVDVTAKGVAYLQTTLTAPADKPFQIVFDNEDAGTPHNVAIHEGSPTGPELFKGEIFPGVATKTYQVAPLKAGTYAFACTVHPSMTGTLTVQ